ncbi:hypothetical protein ACQP2X_48875 [Actinoplanes sp. CA-131856]
MFEKARRDAPDRPADPDESRVRLRLMLQTAGRLESFLKQRRLVLASSSHRMLLVGDSPAVLWHPNGRPQGWTGVLPEDAELLLPVAPNRLLIATKHGENTDVPLTRELANITNEGQVAQCFFAAYRHPDMDWPSNVRLSGQPPEIAAPRITFAPGSGELTFPAQFAPAADPKLRQLIEDLGGMDVVQ